MGILCHTNPELFQDGSTHHSPADLWALGCVIDASRRHMLLCMQAKRGTPCYMAPELFQDGSTHSSAADLWALGCVLYECAAGHPPFVSTSLNQLVNDILTKEPAPLPSESPRAAFMPFLAVLVCLCRLALTALASSLCSCCQQTTMTSGVSACTPDTDLHQPSDKGHCTQMQHCVRP